MLAENPATTTDAPRIRPRSAKKSAARVLVVDDEHLVRWSVTEALQPRGFEVEVAIDAASAMEVFDVDCDLVLLDLYLPDAIDLRVLTFIRSRSSSVPVILMTAFGNRDIVEKAAALGASVLAKPFDMDDLANAVEDALDSRVN